MRATLCALTAAAAVTLVPVAPAHAASTSTGVRCTIVGTPGPDRLRGTSHRDVICGRGGNDVITGGGGNDVIDAGPGNDTVSGGTGDDTIIGGSGADRIDGAAGRDRISGGTGNDTLNGGDGADTISGDTGNDRLAGGTGNDVESGGAGSDAVTGNDGADTLRGADGDDHLLGGTGNDDLDGGSGADTVDGGSGTNWCSVDPSDGTLHGCVYDTQPPTSVEVRLTPTVVDVTSAPQKVTLLVHARDDTGVSEVQLDGYGFASLTSGDVRDGWWTITWTVPRWSKPRAADLDVDLLDRAHRHGFHPYVSALTIEDTNPDTQAPTVVAATVAPARVDVRGADQPVDVTAHITDDRSGLGYAVACLIHQSADGSYGGNGGCMMMNRTRGTATDGWYDADPVIPKGSVGGSWNVVLETQDQVSNSANWLGPDAYRTWPCMGICPDPTAHQLPNGQGRVDVTGVSDPTPPQLQLLSVTPARVDTLPGPVTVSFDVRATDNDGDGINAVGLFLGYNGDAWNGAGPDFNPPDVTAPATGSPTDGTWHVEVTLPQGAPPGVYVPELWVRDAGHWVSYVPPSSPYANQPNQQVMTPAQLGGSDGTVTVVDHTS